MVVKDEIEFVINSEELLEGTFDPATDPRILDFKASPGGVASLDQKGDVLIVLQRGCTGHFTLAFTVKETSGRFTCMEAELDVKALCQQMAEMDGRSYFPRDS